MERIAMSQEERDWLELLKRAKDKVVSQRKAAQTMGVSERWVRKLLQRMKSEGDGVVVHGLRGRASNRKIAVETQAQALQILKQPDWHDFGPTFASEQLAKRHHLEVSDETLRRWMIAEGLWNTLADPAQIENAVLNLAINARDAMPDGGKLTIELANVAFDAAYAARQADVAAGAHVMLAVTDTGTGMTPEVQARAFEPFFTTKPEGRGTGLGLAQVYGFVRQSGGHVRIYSEVGHGTSVKIYLPRAVHAQEWTGAEPLPPVEGGSETILVVEDDAEVRAGAVDVLENLGYRVLQAGDADQALAILRSSAAIDVLFTDVVMPGSIKAAELARYARKIFPRIAVLFTSGYTATAAAQNRELEPDAALLSKPYRGADLARKIRAALAEIDANARVDGAAAASLPLEGGGRRAPDLVRGEPGGAEIPSPHPASSHDARWRPAPSREG